jgi:phosphoenolpyruvate synthase/pyruvate phosphate dikinase
MNLVLCLHEISEAERPRIGGKGFTLAMLKKRGVQAPDACCISAQAIISSVLQGGSPFKGGDPSGIVPLSRIL